MNDYPDQARVTAVGDRVMALVEDDITRSKRRRAIGHVTGVVAVGALLAAGAAIITPQMTIDTGARCYGAPDLSSTFTEAGSVDEDPDGTPQSAATAVELCSNAWEVGLLEPEQDRPAAFERVRSGYTFPVPPLTACRQSDGLTVVLPVPDGIRATTVCSSVGLSRAE